MSATFRSSCAAVTQTVSINVVDFRTIMNLLQLSADEERGEIEVDLFLERVERAQYLVDVRGCEFTRERDEFDPARSGVQVLYQPVMGDDLYQYLSDLEDLALRTQGARWRAVEPELADWMVIWVN